MTFELEPVIRDKHGCLGNRDWGLGSKLVTASTNPYSLALIPRDCGLIILAKGEWKQKE